MVAKAIHNDKEYAAAIAEIERLWDAPGGSEDAIELETWGVLVDAYETSTMSARDGGGVDPVDIIVAEMEMNARPRGDLARIIGQSRASEVLKRQRPLTLDMIRAISEAWSIPANLLIAAYEVMPRRRRTETSAHA